MGLGTGNAKDVTVKDIKDFFGLKLSEMKDQWTNGGLTEKDKEQIKSGLSIPEGQKGHLTY